MRKLARPILHAHVPSHCTIACTATGHHYSLTGIAPHRMLTDMAPQPRRPARSPTRRRAHRPRPFAGMVCKHGGPFGRAGRRFRSEGARRPRPVRRRQPMRRFRSAGPRGRRGQLRVHALAGPVKVALLLVLEHRRQRPTQRPAGPTPSARTGGARQSGPSPCA